MPATRSWPAQRSPGLIHYAWGETGTRSRQAAGSRGTRERVVVLLVLLFYAGGLFTALAMRQAGAGARLARPQRACTASAPMAGSTTGSATRWRIAAKRPPP